MNINCTAYENPPTTCLQPTSFFYVTKNNKLTVTPFELIKKTLLDFVVINIKKSILI